VLKLKGTDGRRKIVGQETSGKTKGAKKGRTISNNSPHAQRD